MKEGPVWNTDGSKTKKGTGPEHIVMIQGRSLVLGLGQHIIVFLAEVNDIKTCTVQNLD
jgi:hypothetical protein